MDIIVPAEVTRIVRQIVIVMFTVLVFPTLVVDLIIVYVHPGEVYVYGSATQAQVLGDVAN
jgi:hypothetical protein